MVLFVIVILFVTVVLFVIVILFVTVVLFVIFSVCAVVFCREIVKRMQLISKNNLYIRCTLRPAFRV